MGRIRVETYAGVNQKVGWNEMEIELESGTVEDVLKLAKINNGISTFDLVADGSGLKSEYSVYLNGCDIGRLEAGLKTKVSDKDRIVVLDVITIPMGG